MNTKMTFTIPEDVADQLKRLVARSRRSAFVTRGLKEKLNQLEEEQLSQTLIEAYVERYEDDDALNEEWEKPTLESWS